MNRSLPPRNVGTALRTGHPDVQGLCLALADWSAELRLMKAGTPAAAGAGRSRAGEGTEPGLLREAVDALAVLPLGGFYIQTHLLAQGPAAHPTES
jgi:hypothetical protein